MHYAVQGALAVALPALAVLAVLAACWRRGRRFLGIAVDLSACYLRLVSFAFPGTWAGLPPLGSALCMAWGAAVAVLAVAAPRLQPRELRREVVETQ